MKVFHLPWRVFAMLAVALVVPEPTHAAPQTFNTALPVSKGNFVLREQLLYRKAGDDSGAMDRNLVVRGGISVLGYGATSQLALFGVLPYLDKELDLRTPDGQRLTRGTSGLGDAQLLARYTLLHQDKLGSTFRVAPFIGIKLPTGDDDDSDSLGQLPQPLQSGSGSWDPLWGVVATYQTLDYQVDAQLSYTANNEANDFEFGDELRLDASLQYRVLPRELGDGVPGFLYGVIETNFLHQAKNEISGSEDANSGDQAGELGRPMNLTIYEGELYVPEYFNDRIQVFGRDGTPRRVIGGPGTGPGEFNAPGGVAVGHNGELYVADFYGQRVQALKPDGAFIRQWGTTGRTGHAVCSFYYPTDVALDRKDNLHIADGYGNRIQVFDTDGAFLRKWGGPFARGIYGPFNGWFTTVTSIAFGPRGNLFAADFYNHRVQKFSPDGTFLTSFGSQGTGAGQFEYVLAVAVTEDGIVFVTDLGNNRIQKWRPAEP